MAEAQTQVRRTWHVLQWIFCLSNTSSFTSDRLWECGTDITVFWCLLIGVNLAMKQLVEVASPLKSFWRHALEHVQHLSTHTPQKDPYRWTFAATDGFHMISFSRFHHRGLSFHSDEICSMDEIHKFRLDRPNDRTNSILFHHRLQLEIQVYRGCVYEKWWLSIAMLVYQRAIVFVLSPSWFDSRCQRQLKFGTSTVLQNCQTLHQPQKKIVWHIYIYYLSELSCLGKPFSHPRTCAVFLSIDSWPVEGPAPTAPILPISMDMLVFLSDC